MSPVTDSDDYVTTATSVHDLGIYIDSDVSMKSHGVDLHCCTSQDQQHKAMSSTAGAGLMGRIAGSHKTGLRLLYAG